MARNDMRLVVSDEPMDIVLLARASEHKLRTDVIGCLIRDGHVRVIEDNDPAVIRLTIEGEIFGDRRDEFPSTGLVARVQLAINAGLSERNVQKTAEDHLTDAMIYGRAVWRTEAWSDAMSLGFTNTAQITATVKKKQKGLRP